MKKYIIDTEQINKILQRLQEAPAKYVFDAIKILHSLDELKEKKQNKKND